jgi:hypothetical protein
MVVGLVALGAARSSGATAPAAAARSPYTVTNVELRVKVGPPGHHERCNIDSSVYVPRDASRTHRVPAIMTANGYLGSKSQAGPVGSPGSIAAFFARRGYVALAYSGLGWGKSSCQIELDNPAYDGRAAAQIIDYLGGDLHSAFRTYTKGVPGSAGAWTRRVHSAPPVLQDAIDHRGHRDRYDPRVGMIGTSYGAGAAFAAAVSSPKLDTIIVQATWNDLAYSLAPNNLGKPGSVAETTRTPGVTKAEWLAELATGGPLQVAEGNGGSFSSCPGFAPSVCNVFISGEVDGYPDPASVSLLNQSSPHRYLRRIHIPVYLLQGEKDSLFNLREATATFLTLRTDKTPVKMLWQSWGHSDQTPAAGEENANAPYGSELNEIRFAHWMGHYLLHRKVSTGPLFSYYRDWVPYSGHGPDRSQYGRSRIFPLRHRLTYLLSGGGSGGGQMIRRGKPAAGVTSLTTSAVRTTSYSETSGESVAIPPNDAPGTAISYTGPRLKKPFDLVGSSTLHIRLSAPAFGVGGANVSRRLVLFAKLYDVAANGRISLPDRLVSPVRINNTRKRLTISLPAIVH